MKKRDKTIFLAIIFLIALVSVSVLYLFLDEPQISECQFDEDCVAESCCHADSCVVKGEAQNCGGMVCTAVCSGPLDCGAGYCGCIQGKCGVVKNE